MSALAELAGAVDPALAPYAVPGPSRGEWEARLADPVRAFVMEAVYEGFLMHYREPRVFAGMDPDLRLLAGDALYALGLERLAERGDLAAVAELADLISLTAQAEAEGRSAEVARLWEATLAALSPGAPAPDRGADRPTSA
jgi:hypothetical protein